MNVSAYAIRNPVVVSLLFTLLTLAGLLAFRSTIVQEFPDVELPIVNVTATLDGAAPEQLETEVARVLEDSVATLAGVKHLHTKISDGEVALTVEFELEQDAAEVTADVRDAVARVRADLPAELREPVVSKASTAGQVVQTFVARSATLDAADLSWLIDDRVAKRLLAVPGVGAVKRIGGVDREIRVELDTARLAALRIPASEVAARLDLVQRESSGGRGDVGGEEQGVRTIAMARTATELAAFELPLADGRRIRLDEIATIRDTIAEPRSAAFLDGAPVIGIEVFRSRGASEVDVAVGARAAIAEIAAAEPRVELTEIIDNSASVQENFDGSMQLLYEGALLAVLVVWWFLRDFRSMLVAAVALPLSVIPTFLAMRYFGFTLNTVTLLSLALVIGILVDDAIVEIENISRHLRLGKSPYQAAMEAADEIGLAVIATTFALVAVFLPTAFMGGIAGKFFKQFGWTAVVAILASLLVARFVTPLMAAYLLRPTSHAAPADSRLMRAYLRAARWCIAHRGLTLGAAAAFFAGSVALVGLLPTGFIPTRDGTQTRIQVELPPGSTLAGTATMAERARALARSVEGVQSVFASIGGGSSGDVFRPGASAETRRAVLTLLLAHRKERSASLKEIESELRARLGALPGARFKVGGQDNGVVMQIVLQGEDAHALVTAARRAERELRTLTGIGAVSSTASLVSPEITVRPDPARAAELGVTTAAIGEVVRIATAGDYDTALTKLDVGARQIPVRVKLPDALRADLEALGRLEILGNRGPVKLAAVAELAIGSGPAQIDRLDRVRNVTLEVELGARNLGEAYEEALALPAFANLPASVRIAELGDTQEMNALFASFGTAMLIGVLCIYGVLVLLFNDFLQPITILGALPLSVGGAFVALLATGSSLSMPAMIGLLMLMGVVTKNSILLVEYAISARRAGLSRLDALLDACHKRSQPIVMTTIAMAAGMLPLALGLGADPTFRAPMAIAVIGGLATSTLLSLVVVPAAFTYVDDAKSRLAALCATHSSHRERAALATHV